MTGKEWENVTLREGLKVIGWEREKVTIQEGEKVTSWEGEKVTWGRPWAG